jgi:hypothetical protein
MNESTGNDPRLIHSITAKNVVFAQHVAHLHTSGDSAPKLPPLPDDYVHRPAITGQIEQACHGPNALVNIWGMGGIGKSVAVRAALEGLSLSREWTHIIWFEKSSADSRLNVSGLLDEVASQISGAAPVVPPAVRLHSLRSLPDDHRILLVVDGLYDADDLASPDARDFIQMLLAGAVFKCIMLSRAPLLRDVPHSRNAVVEVEIAEFTTQEVLNFVSSDSSVGRERILELYKDIGGNALAWRLLRSFVSTAPQSALSDVISHSSSLESLLSRTFSRLNTTAKRILGVLCCTTMELSEKVVSELVHGPSVHFSADIESLPENVFNRRAYAAVRQWYGERPPNTVLRREITLLQESWCGWAVIESKEERETYLKELVLSGTVSVAGETWTIHSLVRSYTLQWFTKNDPKLLEAFHARIAHYYWVRSEGLRLLVRAYDDAADVPLTDPELLSRHASLLYHLAQAGKNSALYGIRILARMQQGDREDSDDGFFRHSRGPHRKWLTDVRGEYRAVLRMLTGYFPNSKIADSALPGSLHEQLLLLQTCADSAFALGEPTSALYLLRILADMNSEKAPEVRWLFWDALVSFSRLLFQRGDSDAASWKIAPLLAEDSSEFRLMLSQIRALSLAGEMSLWRGDLELAGHQFSRMCTLNTKAFRMPVARPYPYNDPGVIYARFLLQAGRISEAKEVASRNVSLCERAEWTLSTIRAKCSLLATEGRLSWSDSLLSEAGALVEAATKLDAALTQVEALSLRAAAYEATGSRTLAVHDLTTAINISVRLGHRLLENQLALIVAFLRGDGKTETGEEHKVVLQRWLFPLPDQKWIGMF